MKCLYFPDRERIWKARSSLKGTQYWLSEDFPPEIMKRHQILNSIRKKAIQENMKASLSVDKLYVEGQMYSVDTIQKLPESLQLVEVATKRSDLHTAFYSQHSPLSNFHSAKFSYENVVYESNEQYFQHQKAIENGDVEIARKILEAKDPLSCYKLGHNITIQNTDDWEKKSIDIMYRGLLATFQQNLHLKAFLISTGTTVILEANPRDKFWSIGLSINDKDIFKPEAWPEEGKNWLGKLLSKVRPHVNVNQ
jgi:ribA/ribD-fused uncharacterized protein